MILRRGLYGLAVVHCRSPFAMTYFLVFSQCNVFFTRLLLVTSLPGEEGGPKGGARKPRRTGSGRRGSSGCAGWIVNSKGTSLKTAIAAASTVVKKS